MSIGVIAAHSVISSGGNYSSEVLADSPLAYWRCEDTLTLYNVTASSSYNATTLPPWAAFCDDLASAWLANGTGSGWLQAQLTSAVVLTQYSFVREDFNSGQRCAKDWTFQGSNDGSTWTTLDTRTGIVWTTTSERKTFTFTNSTAYLYYRINVTATNGDPYLTIKGMTLGTSPVILRNAAGIGRGAVPTHVTLGASSASALGTAVSFDGSTSHADVPYVSWMDLTTAFSIEAWVKTTATGIHNIADRDGGSSRVYQFRMNGGSLEFVKISGGIVTASQACSLNDGAWHHVVATYDGSNIRLYKDGSLINTTAAAGTLTGSDGLTIGVNQSAGYNAYWNGQLDEIAYYKTVLSGSRIAAHYAAA